MKKTYIKLNMRVVKLTCNPLMLSASTPLTSTNATQDVNGDYNDARGFDFDEE